MTELGKLFRKHSADKAVHGYDVAYETLFDGFKPSKRLMAVKLLEIGVAGGGSLRAWREYFPWATIYGIDIQAEAKEHTIEGGKVFIGDQADVDFLRDVVVEAGPFDIIIDDGGHHMHQQQVSFTELWPALNPGGIYVIEDLHTSYSSKMHSTAVGFFPTAEWLLHTVKQGIQNTNYSGREHAGWSHYFYKAMCAITKIDPETISVYEGRKIEIKEGE